MKQKRNFAPVFISSDENGRLTANVDGHNLDSGICSDKSIPETVKGSTLTVGDGGCYEWDISQLTAGTITMPANHRGVSMAEAWITLGAATAVTLDPRITMKDASAQFATGENHVLVQLRNNTGKVFML